MKKLMVGLIVFFGVLVVSAIVIPLVVDVDQYRPKIVQLANENLNGKLDLGKLSLSLWGTIKIHVGGMALKDSKQNTVLSVQEAFVHIPWISIFKSSPEFILKMKGPKLNVLREKTGEINVTTLLKSDPSASDSRGRVAQAKETSGSISNQLDQTSTQSTKELVLPAIALRARLGLELIQAELKFTDLQASNHIELKELNVSIRDMGLTHPMDFIISTMIDTTLSSGTTIKGPIELSGKVSPEIDSGKLGKISAKVVFKGTDLQVEQRGVFSKAPGILTHADLDVVYSDPIISLNQIKIQFHNAVITAKGQVSEKATQVSLESNEVDLGAWKALIPAIRENSVRGFFAFQAKTQGPNDRLDYLAEVKLRDVSVKNPMLKAEPKIGVTLNIKTDQIESLLMQVVAPGNDLQVRGKLKSFTQPQFDFQIYSKSLDLDQLLVFPSNEEASKKKGASIFWALEAYATQKGKSAIATDLDRSLDGFRTSPIVARASGGIEFNLQKIKAQDVVIDSMKGRLTLNDGVATLSGFGFKVFDGAIEAGAKIALKPARPTYQFTASVSKLSIQKAVDSQIAMFKNTIYGTADFKVEGSGSSLNPDLATKNLNAKGSFKLSNAKFTSIDIAKIVNESLDESLGKITSKIPGLASKGVKKLSSGAIEYELISSDFQIKDSVFSMPNFLAVSKPGKAVDLKGHTTVNLVNQGLQARWEVIDVHNITGAKDLSVDIAGKRIESILAEKGQPVRFPVVVSGTLASPQVSKTETIEHLMKVALKNTSSGVAAKVKDDVVNKVLKGVGLGGSTSGKDSAPADSNPLKGGLKKLFR